MTASGGTGPTRIGAYKAILAGLVFLTAQGAFSVVTRVIGGEDDIAHPLLHLTSGALGLALARHPRSLSSFALGFGAAYLFILGVGGATGVVKLSWLALGTVDHVFHVVVGTAAFVAGAVNARLR